jgi:hypothetical protein
MTAIVFALAVATQCVGIVPGQLATSVVFSPVNNVPQVALFRFRPWPPVLHAYRKVVVYVSLLWAMGGNYVSR